jgi:hypothetical protein
MITNTPTQIPIPTIEDPLQDESNQDEDITTNNFDEENEQENSNLSSEEDLEFETSDDQTAFETPIYNSDEISISTPITIPEPEPIVEKTPQEKVIETVATGSVALTGTLLAAGSVLAGVGAGTNPMGIMLGTNISTQIADKILLAKKLNVRFFKPRNIIMNKWI